jgi:ankyrin repeat protein
MEGTIETRKMSYIAGTRKASAQMSEEIFKAIESHDAVTLARLLAEGADANSVEGKYNWSALHAAIEELEHGGPVESLVLLLRHGAAVEGSDEVRDATPLLMAIFRGQQEAVRILLAMGADVNVVGSEGDSPLRWAVEQEDVQLVALLLNCGAASTINEAGGITGMSALGHAVSRLNEPLVRLLISAGAEPGALDADRQTAAEHLPDCSAESRETWDRICALLQK